MVAFRAAFNPPTSDHPAEQYEFRVSDTHFVLEVDNGKLNSYLGSGANPAFILTTDSTTFSAIVSGSISLRQAEEKQLLHVLGSRAALGRWLQMWDASEDNSVNLGA